MNPSEDSLTDIAASGPVNDQPRRYSTRHARIPESPQGYLGIDSPKRVLTFFICLAAALGVIFLPGILDALDPPARRALFILLFAAGLWTTGAIPAFAVGLLVIGLEVALLGTRRGGAESPETWKEFAAVIGHPLVWLFFGGFVLAEAMAKTGLDRRLANALLTRLGDRPGRILAGVMAVTFILSMFMSNTATAAMMLAMLGPLLAGIDRDDPFGRGLLLGLAVAANIGGMASLIGTPPNAIAVGALDHLPESAGATVDFLKWILIAGPIAVVLAVLSGFVILRLYRPATQSVRLDTGVDSDPALVVPLYQKIVTVVTLFATVGLWLTAQLHPIPTTAVSFVPIILLTMTGVLAADDIRGLSYDVLFLLAGGMALGNMVVRTGLSDWIVSGLPTESLGFTGTALMMCYLTVVLSNLMSNTATANILIPLGVAMAVGSEPRIALPIAMSASSAMLLPISTPPNAIVFASGRLQTADLVRIGILLAILTPLASVFIVDLWYA